MSDRILLRLAKINEAERLSDIAFQSKAYWGYSKTFMEACREELSVSQADIENPAYYHKVAVIDDTVVGYYALAQLSPKTQELEALFVSPDYLRRGIGAKLLKNATAYAKTKGIHSIYIQSDPNATDFYLKAGAIKIGERESSSIPGRSLPLLQIIC